VLKEYGNQIHGLCKNSERDDDSDSHFSDDDSDLQRCRFSSTTLLHPAVREGNVNIIRFCLESAQAAEDTAVVNKLLLEKDKEGHTAWHEAVFSNNTQVLQMLWQCPEGNPSADDLRRKMLFVKDGIKMNALQLAVRLGKEEVLMKQWELAKENLTRGEVKELLIATDIRSRTVLHLAAYNHKQGVLQGVLKLAKENLTPEEVKELLLATDDKGRTFFHMAAILNGIEEIQGIYNFAKENLEPMEVKNFY
jgi:ankyrin repeat protein